MFYCIFIILVSLVLARGMSQNENDGFNGNEVEKIACRWYFSGENRSEFKNNAVPVSDYTGFCISASYIKGYTLSGFNEDGIAEVLFLDIYTSMGAKGLFQSVSADASRKSIKILIDPETGSVFLSSPSTISASSSAAKWTAGKVETSFALKINFPNELESNISILYRNSYSVNSYNFHKGYVMAVPLKKIKK